MPSGPISMLRCNERRICILHLNMMLPPGRHFHCCIKLRVIHKLNLSEISLPITDMYEGTERASHIPFTLPLNRGARLAMASIRFCHSSAGPKLTTRKEPTYHYFIVRVVYAVNGLSLVDIMAGKCGYLFDCNEIIIASSEAQSVWKGGYERQVIFVGKPEKER
uniref:Ribosomal protein S4 n=1 Tax=Picea glauca TaxID=3330 RepID=A0A101M0G6_PICGL|nr:ribosomal protein S4 [Picea glauca]QHR86521.1 putative ribosomal protein S4 [Picea sitchensis]